MDEPGHGGEVTTVLLVRHGLCDPVGRSIAGRGPGVHLNPAGRGQVEALATVLARLPIAAIYAGPLERARETAAPLGQQLGLPIRLSEELDELDYGEWTGRTLQSLAEDPLWQRYNRERGAVRIPGGETMGEVAARASRAMAAMCAAHAGALVAAVTHGDVIRALLAVCAGMALDHMLRLEIAPGSVSVVRFSPDPQLLAVNWLPNLGGLL